MEHERSVHSLPTYRRGMRTCWVIDHPAHFQLFRQWFRDDDILVKFKGGELTIDSVEVVNEGVLVQVQDQESETRGGLLLAASKDSTKRPSTGVVAKVGPGRMAASGELIPMSVKEGDQVKFMDFAGNEVKIGDVEYSVVKMPEIYAKF